MKKKTAKETVKEISPIGPQRQWSGRGATPVGSAGIPGYRVITPEEWVEEFYRLNERLSSFNDGTHTKKISGHVNIDALKRMVRTYRIILDAQEEEYRGNLSWMKKEVEKIYRRLNELSKKGWLNPSDRKEVKEQIRERIFRFSRNGLQYIRHQKRGKTNGKPQDIAFNALAYWVCQNLKTKTGKSQYNLVLNFLEEQQVINQEDATINEENFPRRIQRIRPDVLDRKYSNIRNAAIDTFILSKKNIELEYRTCTASLLIPSFKSFL